MLISQTDIGCNNSSTSAQVSQSEDDPTGVLVSKANIGVKNTSTSLYGTEFNLGFPFELKTRLGEMVFNLEGVLRSQKYVFFFFNFSSYFASISLYKNFHDPKTIPSWRKKT